MKIGFIGLGTMGGPIAARLLAAGHDLVVNDLDPELGSPLIDGGAGWAETPAEVASVSELVYTSLPSPRAVEEVALGEKGLIAGEISGTTYVDLSTNSPTLMRRIHAEFKRVSAAVLDSPVSGGPAGAASGKLAMMVGGDADVYDRVLPQLTEVGHRPQYIGPSGAGCIAKLMHNCAGYIINTALAEVFTVGVKAGLDPMALWASMRQGGIGRRRSFDGLAKHFLPNDYEPEMTLLLARKDVMLATDLAREYQVPTRLADLALNELTEAVGRGWGERDSRVSMLLQQERAGTHIELPREALDAELVSDH